MEQELFSTAQIAAELVHKSKNPRRDVLNIAQRLGFTPVAEQSRKGKFTGGKPEKLWSKEQKDAILADNQAWHKEPAQILSSDEKPNDTPVVAEPAPVLEVITLAGRANRIRKLQADVQRGIIQIGEELIAAKEEVGHGNWSTWLETEFSWTQRTANNFMRVAERFGKMENVFQFQPSALQAMLALPEGTEQEFIAAQADQGTPVETQSARDVQKNVKAFKDARANTKRTAEEPTPDLEPKTAADETVTADNHDREVVTTPAADPLPATTDAPKMENVFQFQLSTFQGDVFTIIKPEQIIALHELVTATDDLHALKAIHDSLLALGQEIGNIVLLTKIKLGEP